MEPVHNFSLMFGRLEGKVDALLSSMARYDSRLEEHDNRITELEALRHQGTGAFRTLHLIWIGIGGLAVTVFDKLLEYLTR